MERKEKMEQNEGRGVVLAFLRKNGVGNPKEKGDASIGVFEFPHVCINLDFVKRGDAAVDVCVYADDARDVETLKKLEQCFSSWNSARFVSKCPGKNLKKILNNIGECKKKSCVVYKFRSNVKWRNLTDKDCEELVALSKEIHGRIESLGLCADRGRSAPQKYFNRDKAAPQDLKTYQVWSVDTLTDILSNLHDYRGSFSDQGYHYVIDAIIKHYASMSYCGPSCFVAEGKLHVNFWWNIFSRKRKDSRKLNEAALKNLMMSKEARSRALENHTIEEFKKLLHFEHITPCARVYADLQKLFEDGGISAERVRHCFKHNKLVLMTKEESKILDGEGASFSKEDVDLLREWGFVEELGEAQQHLGDKPKSGGTALLRLALLYRHNVRFCSYTGETMPPNSWASYLSDASFVLKA